MHNLWKIQLFTLFTWKELRRQENKNRLYNVFHEATSRTQKNCSTFQPFRGHCDNQFRFSICSLGRRATPTHMKINYDVMWNSEVCFICTIFLWQVMTSCSCKGPDSNYAGSGSQPYISAASTQLGNVARQQWHKHYPCQHNFTFGKGCCLLL